MAYQKTHCPFCNGTGKTLSALYDSVACLNCKGSGTVRLASGPQLDNATQGNGQVHAAKLAKQLTRQSRRYSIKSKIDRKSTYLGFILILLGVCLIGIIFYSVPDVLWLLLIGLLVHKKILH